MRRHALRLLACPDCRGDLALAITDEADDGHVMTGSLSCACGATYPITRGVPRLVPGAVAASALETASRFSAQWATFDHLADYHEEWFRRWLEPLGPEDFRGRVVLEGGCGKGRHTLIAAGWGAADVVALDLGDCVDVAFAHTRGRENAHVVQGDLLRPPVKPVFDLAFSIGVLHHLPDPRAGFDTLRRLVRRGGRIAIWVYGHESNEWIVRWVNPVRENVTSRLPPRLLYWLTLPPSAVLAAGTKLYRSPRLARRLPYRDYLQRLAEVPLREVHNIVYDQLVTPLAFYLKGEEVEGWFAQEGLADVTIAWHNRSSWRGTAKVTAPPGGRGPAAA